MKIYLVRHTAVGVPEGKCYGQTDVPLKETFEEEAERVKQKLNLIRPDIVCSSPLSRCLRLARYCGYKNVRLHDRLKEIHFGDWEMKNWNEIDMDIWRKDWVNVPSPNGESFKHLYNRVSSFFDYLLTQNYKSVIIFTHGGVISCARVYFKQADIKQTFDLMPAYGEIVQFEG